MEPDFVFEQDMKIFHVMSNRQSQVSQQQQKKLRCDLKHTFYVVVTHAVFLQILIFAKREKKYWIFCEKCENGKNGLKSVKNNHKISEKPQAFNFLHRNLTKWISLL